MTYHSKHCRGCDRTLSLASFYLFTNKAYVSVKCKECTKADQRMRYYQSREKDLAAFRQKETARKRKYRRPAPNTMPEVTSARTAVGNAIRDGKMFKPSRCQQCGKSEHSRRIHAHHEDYTKPLQVIFLCSVCHGQRHRKYTSA